jgi:hypothetical protein
VFGGTPQRSLNQLRHPRDPRQEDFRILRRLGRQTVPPQRVRQAVQGRLHVLHLLPQRRQIASLPVSAFVGNLQVREELPLERRQHFDERHVALDGSELRLHKAPRRLGKPPLLGILDLKQVDQPALGRNQQAGGLLAGVQIQHDAAHDPPRVVVIDAPPDAGVAADLQRQIEDAILEIFDPTDVRKRTAIRNRDPHDSSRIDY